ncbi:MAG: inositol monophosphatase [Gammaproteobacteria bacterium RIFCSPHIGHO2_12_FULL_42_10]|nr:MAG: inositol monophosphatase [Gammaproteobacteria bacterium RIFCSPHIGHO2_12_FULL_42_10]
MQEPIINIAITAARKGGETIMRVLDRVDSVKIAEKAPNDFVTEIDRRVESDIITLIQKSYPDHSILGEEYGEQPGNDYQWIIDPIDGTRNFIHGFPYFSISIAFAYKNRIEHGVVYDPVRQELFAASRGKGARLNDRKIRVGKQKQLKTCLIGTESHGAATLISKIGSACGDLRHLGSAALDLAYVASGRLDGFFGHGLKIWDIAAGVLLIREAGGIVCDPYGSEDFLKDGDIVAGNPAMLRQLLKLIAEN